MKAKERARMLAYVPQEPVLPPDLTVAQYVMLGRTPHLGYLAMPGRHDRERVLAAMERLDVARFADRRLARLSGGERQRAVLARALAGDPECCCSTSRPRCSMSVTSSRSLSWSTSSARRRGLTVVSTLHDLTVAGQYADALVMLDGGRVVASGRPEAVLTKALIETVYAARVSVSTGTDGHPVVAPLRRPPAEIGDLP